MPRRTCVPEHVRERLLNNPVSAERNILAKADRLSLDVQLDPQAGFTDLRDERFELGGRRLWRTLRWRVRPQ